MTANEAIAKGVCPMCLGERVTWKPIGGTSEWCTCCGGTGEFPSTQGDGLYDLTVDYRVPAAPVTLKRESRYRKQADTADEALAKAKKKHAETQANPNVADGEWDAIRRALGHHR